MAPPWTTTPGAQRSEKIAVTADLPDGWARYNADQGLLLTRDGPLLQSIHVTRDNYGATLSNTDRTITKDAEPQEVAQILIDAMTADQAQHHLVVVDNRPATVSGYPGIRLEVTYKTAKGLTMHETTYLALTGETYVVVRYSTPDRYYHERDAGVFEKVVSSLKIDEQAAK